MPSKRKKYPKMPNGFGSIKYLGKGRLKPYAVHPPTTEFALNGSPITPKAICYVDDWMIGFRVLVSHKAGTYKPGDELAMKEQIASDDLGQIAKKIMTDYSMVRGVKQVKKLTFTEVYNAYYEEKYLADKSRTYAKNTIGATKAAYKHCAALHNKNYCDLRYDDFQDVVDACELKHATLEHIVNLLKQMGKYAEKHDIVERNYSKDLIIKIEDDDEHGVPFTEDELKILWANKDDPNVEFILIMCYSGYRISAYRKMEINLDELYFKGGVKNKYSIERVVPIHSKIVHLVSKRLARDKRLLTCQAGTFSGRMETTLREIGIAKHTPHDCRHTFSWMCEKCKVNENDRRRMLGHSFGSDITNQVYGHRTLEDLRTEIEKIDICY